jgi:aryl-alcohol dehydrogenase-like predicted oxidoreductase
MHYRTLGRTGIKVSPYCLGAMMFGGIANSDHDECIRIIHKALDFGHRMQPQNGAWNWRKK